MILTALEGLELFGEHSNHPGRLVEAIEKAVLKKLVSGFWIKTADSLPVPGVSVLAAPTDSDVEVLEYWEKGPDHAAPTGWYDADGVRVENVTHWTPIPANPNLHF